MEIRTPWWGGTVPQNAKGSTITLGAGEHGRVIVTSTTLLGEMANGQYSIEVVAGVGANVDMSAAYANGVITVTLGTDGGSALDNAKNTAILVAAEINALADFSAIHTGNGSGVIPITAQKAKAIVGDGETENGFITVEYDTPGIAGNALKIVVEDGLVNGNLAVTEADGVITITLGMDANTDPDDAKNTATLIETEINKIAGFTATKDGTGAEVPDIADGDEILFAGGTTGVLPLAGGTDATECPEPSVLLRNWDAGNARWDYYTNIAPNGKNDANWRVFNLVEY
jgi:hypothetical protein